MIRPRFHIRTLLALPAVAALVIVGLDALYPEGCWVGRTTIALEFLVVDAETGQPVPAAILRLKALIRPEVAVETGRDGRVVVVIEADCGGRFSLFRRTRYIDYRGWNYTIEASVYQRSEGSLGDFTSDAQRYHAPGAVPPPITIRLGKRSPKP